LHAISLNESQSAITAIANDYGFDFVFERLVEAELRKGDLLIALSTSGKSANVLRAINKALAIGVDVHLWTGSSNPDLRGVDIWNCALDSTPRIQELHLIWGHLLAEYVELHFQ
jgi:D-sedoheptulose 7-phosphate isomerase